MSNLINTIQQTMSSIEIANLTGKQHKHVMRDIRELNEGYEKLYLPKIGLKHRISDLGGGRQRPLFRANTNANIRPSHWV